MARKFYGRPALREPAGYCAPGTHTAAPSTTLTSSAGRSVNAPSSRGAVQRERAARRRDADVVGTGAAARRPRARRTARRCGPTACRLPAGSLAVGLLGRGAPRASPAACCRLADLADCSRAVAVAEERAPYLPSVDDRRGGVAAPALVLAAGRAHEARARRRPGQHPLAVVRPLERHAVLDRLAPRALAVELRRPSAPRPASCAARRRRSRRCRRRRARAPSGLGRKPRSGASGATCLRCLRLPRRRGPDAGLVGPHQLALGAVAGEPRARRVGTSTGVALPLARLTIMRAGSLGAGTARTCRPRRAARGRRRTADRSATSVEPSSGIHAHCRRDRRAGPCRRRRCAARARWPWRGELRDLGLALAASRRRGTATRRARR